MSSGEDRKSEKYSWRGNNMTMKLGMTPPPCWNNGEDCKKRYVGCRTECEAWLEYLAIHEKECEEIRKKKSDERDAETFMVESGKRTKLSRRREYYREKRRDR